MKKIKARKFRRLNLYICSICGHPRGTLVYSRKVGGLCRKCARNQVPENQQSLFIEPATSPREIINIAFLEEKKTIKHLDLFSGIGGFALAVDTVWPGAEHIFCDNDKFCQAVLKKHWPNSKIYGDIRALHGDGFTAHPDRDGQPTGNKKINPTKTNEQTFDNAQKHYGKIDILTGGFPCQPFSQAGKRRGAEDDRFLWPEMLRVIREFKPSWVIAENVRGLLTQGGGLVFEQVCADLETSNYEVQPLIIPAVAVNAPHRRDRVWFIAHRTSDRRIGRGSTIQDEKGYAPRSEQTGELARGFERPRGDGNATDTNARGIRRHERQSNQEAPTARDSWERNWLETATEFCSLDDGLPAELDGLKLSKAGHRTQQLKAYGNSIVPQVAIKILEAIKYAQNI